MNRILKSKVVIFILLFSSSFLYSQTADTTVERKTNNNLSIIRALEENYSIKIFFDPATIEKFKLTENIEKTLPLDDALKALVYGTDFVLLKLQDASYMLATGEAVRTITEKTDRQQKTESGIFIIGNIESYKKNKAAVITGIVKEGKTGNPITGATVLIKSLDIGVATDVKGGFTFLVKPGNYTLDITSVEFEDFTSEIKVLSSGSVEVELFDKSIKLEEVNVFSKKADRNISSDKMSLIELDKKTIKQLPMLTGEKDLIKSFAMLPGIKSTGEFGTGISVRGGGNDQNLFLIEETPIYNTSHVFGLISALSPEAVSNVNLYKGYIPANYGERASSIIDIQLKRGNEKMIHANGGIGLFSSRLSIDGPLIKNKATFLLAARSSYSSILLNRMPDVELSNSKANFYDVTGNFNASITKKQRLFGMFYTSYDYFDYSNQLQYINQNSAGELKWNYARSTKTNYMLALSYSGNNITKRDVETKISSSLTENSIKSISFRGDAEYKINPKNLIQTGVQLIHYTINPGNQEPLDTLSSVRNIELEHNQGVESAVYINDNITLNNAISFNLGLRYSMFFNLGPQQVYNYQPGSPRLTIIDSTLYAKNEVIQKYQGFEPRLSFKYQFGNTLSTKLSYNRNIQYISMISASAAQSPDDIWQLSNKYNKPILSNTISWGIYKNLKQNTIETSVEVYYRKLNHLTEYKNGAQLTLNPHIETELLDADGKSYGIEFLLKKTQGNLDGWVGYTYSHSLKKTNGEVSEEIINGNNYYPSSYDKPHDFNLMFTYHVNRRLRFSSNFTYSTGRAVTLPEAIYFTDNNWIVTYRDRNSERLPDYHRLDISVSMDENLRIKRVWKGSWTFSLLNVYSRKNVYSIFFKSEVPTIENNYRNFGLYKLYIIGRPLPTITYNFIF